MLSHLNEETNGTDSFRWLSVVFCYGAATVLRVCFTMACLQVILYGRYNKDSEMFLHTVHQSLPDAWKFQSSLKKTNSNNKACSACWEKFGRGDFM